MRSNPGVRPSFTPRRASNTGCETVHHDREIECEAVEEVYRNLLTAGSRGRYFHEHVRGNYEYRWLRRFGLAVSYNRPSGD
jgi:hypothetical protein